MRLPASSERSFVGFREHAEEFGHVSGQLTRAQLPPPIAGRGTWLVHSRLAAKAEQILSRDDRRVGHRRERGANQIPVHLTVVLDAQITARVFVLAGDVFAGPRAV